MAATGAPEPTASLEARAKATTLIVDHSKQLITLSTAVTGVTMTFLRDIAASHSEGRIWILAAWIAFAVSILAGVGLFMAIIGQQAQSDDPDPMSTQLRAWGALQIVAFFVGIFLLGVAVLV